MSQVITEEILNQDADSVIARIIDDSKSDIYDWKQEHSLLLRYTDQPEQFLGLRNLIWEAFWPFDFPEIEPEEMPMMRHSYRLLNLPLWIDGNSKKIAELKNNFRAKNGRVGLIKCIDIYNGVGGVEFVEVVKEFKIELANYEKLFFKECASYCQKFQTHQFKMATFASELFLYLLDVNVGTVLNDVFHPCVKLVNLILERNKHEKRESDTCVCHSYPELKPLGDLSVKIIILFCSLVSLLENGIEETISLINQSSPLECIFQMILKPMKKNPMMITTKMMMMMMIEIKKKPDMS
ncbi:unnamed protein product [Ambrosiozyma monospora]|uniref:Unnamed protein product n=1 Tax=Ambrosiozyma monospora TaxID=43982 RepID=A0ACB5SZR1_AMBMO|nr:unnamed protein product [Ambrosiozyma monospora]